jgi:hypothetical protein
MNWRNSLNSWKSVEFYTYNDRGGKLFSGIDFPNQWKWRGNIVIADSLDEAKEKFMQQFRLEFNYWERIGTGNFMWVVGEHRGAIYRHKSDETLWKFKDYIFHAESGTKAYELLFDLFVKRESA